MRDMAGRVVATKHAGRPELGFIGSVEFEITSRRQSRIQQLWHLLNYAELVNIGTGGRSMGFGVAKITATSNAGGGGEGNEPPESVGEIHDK